MPIIKSFCLFTSHHTTKPSKYFLNNSTLITLNQFSFFNLILIVPDSQYNIQTGAIACQFGPSMINSLTAAVQLWNNHSYFITTPYIICNDTDFQIM